MPYLISCKREVLWEVVCVYNNYDDEENERKSLKRYNPYNDDEKLPCDSCSLGGAYCENCTELE